MMQGMICGFAKITLHCFSKGLEIKLVLIQHHKAHQNMPLGSLFNCFCMWPVAYLRSRSKQSYDLWTAWGEEVKRRKSSLWNQVVAYLELWNLLISAWGEEQQLTWSRNTGLYKKAMDKTLMLSFCKNVIPMVGMRAPFSPHEMTWMPPSKAQIVSDMLSFVLFMTTTFCAQLAIKHSAALTCYLPGWWRPRLVDFQVLCSKSMSLLH